MTHYDVSAELVFHQGGIRSIGVLENGTIVTGAMDSTVCLWLWDDTNHTYTPLVDSAIYHHEHWVTALVPFSSGMVSICPHGGFITGSMDKRIRIFQSDSTLSKELHGHEGGVISLAFNHTRLLSGSWDGTARIWDLTTFECLTVLSNHENGVCVLGLPDQTIVTGSTGRQVGNTVADFQLRFWSKDGQLIKTLQDHTGPIRQLVNLPGIGFVSCSNDGSICVRTIDGQVLAVMNHPLNAEGKPGFVLGITVLSNQSIVSASEDGTARVWNVEGTLIQTIEHPSGLWCVSSTSTGDFITGCDDKIARVFSCDPVKMSETAQVSFTQAVEEARLIRARGPNDVDIEKLSDYSQRFQVEGKSDGQIQMFRKGTIAMACQWSQPSRTWIDIGQVTGTGTGGIVDGKAYDMVIPVEIEQPNGIRRLQLGYNQGENPFIVAQEFVNQHMLEQSYVREIADYITQRSDSYQPPILSSNETIPSPYTCFPVNGYNTFEGMKITKLMNTVRQLNQNMKEMELNEKDLNQLETIVTTLQQTAFYHSSLFTSLDVLVRGIVEWPCESVFPFLDILRLVLLHPHGPILLNQHLEKILNRMVELGRNHESPMTTRMLALRVIVNMFYHEQSRHVLMTRQDHVIQALSEFVLYRQKTMILSLATLVLNLSRLSMETTLSDNNVIHIGSIAMDLLIGSSSLQEIGEDAVLRALVTVGTLIVTYPSVQVKNAFKSLVQVFVSNKGSEVQSDRTQTCMKELEQVVA